jgi:glutamyl-tRNA reductase
VLPATGEKKPDSGRFLDLPLEAAILLGAGAAGAAIAESLLEAIYSATTIDNLLLARVERMAQRTHVNMKIFTQSGSCLNAVTAAACCSHSIVLGVNFRLHVKLLIIGTATRSCVGHRT